MKLNYKQLEVAAKQLGVSERAVERLMGGTTVEIIKKIDIENTENLHDLADKSVERFQVGLRLQGESSLMWTKSIEELCIRSLQEYRSKCPQVFSWLCSGNFDPKKAPDNVNRGNIFHASRTASRLRAGIFREIQRITKI